MSARGWAGVVRDAARVLQAMIEEFPAHQPSVDAAALQDVAALRELAALLDRITPEMARALTVPTDDRTSKGAALAADAEQIIAALARGPAEQQETGR